MVGDSLFHHSIEQAFPDLHCTQIHRDGVVKHLADRNTKEASPISDVFPLFLTGKDLGQTRPQDARPVVLPHEVVGYPMKSVKLPSDEHVDEEVCLMFE